MHLRAYTPRDQKAVISAASTFRPNPKLKTEQVITELGVGEALVSFLDPKGIPGMVERAFIVPPQSKIGIITPEERRQLIRGDMVYGTYEQMIDRDSAFEVLQRRMQQQPLPQAQEPGSLLRAPGCPGEPDVGHAVEVCKNSRNNGYPYDQFRDRKTTGKRSSGRDIRQYKVQKINGVTIASTP